MSEHGARWIIVRTSKRFAGPLTGARPDSPQGGLGSSAFPTSPERTQSVTARPFSG